jgi:hypothetical protein
MRNLFWLLLLTNVILFALMQRGGFDWGEQQVKAEPELNGDMIRLLPEPQSPTSKSSASPAPAKLPTPAPTPPVPAPGVPAQVVAPPEPVASPPPSTLTQNIAAAGDKKPGKLICLEWGDFSGSDLSRAEAALSVLQLADRLSQRQIEQDIGYWVYMPPLRNKNAVKRKIGELKALGITEYFVIPGSGQWQNAISLGVFKTREAAENFLHALNTKGVHTAKVGERASKLITTLFTLNQVDAATELKVKEIQKDFPGSELNHVPCGLTR